LENTLPGSFVFMQSSPTLSKAIQRKRVEVKSFLKKSKSFDDLALVPSHLSTTADGKKFLLLKSYQRTPPLLPADPRLYKRVQAGQPGWLPPVA
jgi:hypothetical protein